MLWKIAFAALAGALVLGSAGCREEGPAEKMGRQLDEAVDEAQDEAEELKKKITEP